MKNILVITLVLSVLAAGIVGLMWLFGLMHADRIAPILAKTVGGFIILGVCAAAISALMPARKDSSE